MKLFQLEKLKSPKSRSKKIELQNLSISTLNNLLKSMLKIRLVEKKLAKEKEKKNYNWASSSCYWTRSYWSRSVISFI